MPDSPAVKNKKPFAVAVLRVGTHPVVYSVMAILAIGLMVFFLAIVPLVRMLQSGGKASVADANARNAAAQNTLAAEKKLAATAAALSAKDRSNLSYALPMEADTPGLAIIFYALCLHTGVKMSSLDIAAAVEGTPSQASAQSVGKLRVTVAIDQVTYDRLKIFLINTQQSLRLFDLRSMSYSPSTGSANFQFDTYYLTKS